MGKLCAPVRDDDIRELKATGNIVEMLRLALLFLEFSYSIFLQKGSVGIGEHRIITGLSKEFFFLAVLGIKPRPSHIIGKHAITELHPQLPKEFLTL